MFLSLHTFLRKIANFACRMDIDEKTHKYGNFLRFIRKRLLVLDAKHDQIC